MKECFKRCCRCRFDQKECFRRCCRCRYEVGEEDDDESALSQLGLRRNTSYTSSTASTASSAANGWGFSTWVSCTRASFARMTEIPASSPPKFASTQCGSGFFLRGFNMEASSTDQMSLIKQLRERTNAPIKDVKATLIDSNWDIEAAQKELRRKGKVSASKKSSRMAAEGMLALAQNENKLLLLNFNFETDFVAPNDIFQYLVRPKGIPFSYSSLPISLGFITDTVNSYILNSYFITWLLDSTATVHRLLLLDSRGTPISISQTTVTRYNHISLPCGVDHGFQVFYSFSGCA
ncbi:hypothetical protein DVH24_013844 [Malus domestica]|uniref:Elongation factor Ts, mitochondrial n=1 Tax=Malus domestica TaxID=3750 RepID=A0A498JC07_MALDO|nr:hypothetical protein DVH24_013844 [Malus domestica]